MTSLNGQAHEEAFVNAFVQKERRERSLFLLSEPNRRREFTCKLAHFPWFDRRFTTAVPGSVAHTSSELVSLLRSKGAGPSVWAISEDRSIDGQELAIADAVDQIWGKFMGGILSCVPGKLVFYRGEEMNSETLLLRP